MSLPYENQQHSTSSYPPLFRRNNPNSTTAAAAALPLPRPLVETELPFVDLNNPDTTVLLSACKELGIFRLVNHGVPTSLSAEIHLRSNQLLSLPFDTKQQRHHSVFHDPVTYFWGTPAVTENVRNVNWLEGFHIPLSQMKADGPCGGGSDQDQDECFGSSSFWTLVQEYGHHMARITRTVFKAMAEEDLRLTDDQSSSYLSDSNAMFRVYRYPICPESSSYFGMDSHTDSSVLSIVNEDDVGGLQFRRGEEWFDVRPFQGTLVVNLGDMMQAISDDKYKSVEHRVLASSNKERISLCYFAFPKEDAVIVGSRYKPFTYKDFKAKVQEDIRAVGFKVGLDRFKNKQSTLLSS